MHAFVRIQNDLKVERKNVIDISISLVWGCLAKGLNTTASDSGLNLPDERVDQGCWIRSGFESPQGQLVVSLFQYPISYGYFTGAILYVPCLDWRLIKYIQFISINSLIDSGQLMCWTDIRVKLVNCPSCKSLISTSWIWKKLQSTSKYTCNRNLE